VDGELLLLLQVSLQKFPEASLGSLLLLLVALSTVAL
jgi:hypothetical protein